MDAIVPLASLVLGFLLREWSARASHNRQRDDGTYQRLIEAYARWIQSIRVVHDRVIRQADEPWSGSTDHYVDQASILLLESDATLRRALVSVERAIPEALSDEWDEARADLASDPAARNARFEEALEHLTFLIRKRYAPHPKRRWQTYIEFLRE